MGDEWSHLSPLGFIIPKLFPPLFPFLERKCPFPSYDLIWMKILMVLGFRFSLKMSHHYGLDQAWLLLGGGGRWGLGFKYNM